LDCGASSSLDELDPGQLQLSISIDSFVDSFAVRLCEASGDVLRQLNTGETA